MLYCSLEIALKCYVLYTASVQDLHLIKLTTLEQGAYYCRIMLFPNSTALVFIPVITVCILNHKRKPPARKKRVVAFLPLLFQCRFGVGVLPCGLRSLSEVVIVFLSNKIGFCCICTSLLRSLDLRGCNGPLIPEKGTRKKGGKMSQRILAF